MFPDLFQTSHQSRFLPFIMSKLDQKMVGMPDNDITLVPTHDIEGKYEDLDDRRLRAQGHTSQLGRSFSWLGAVGLAYRSVLIDICELTRSNPSVVYLIPG